MAFDTNNKITNLRVKSMCCISVGCEEVFMLDIELIRQIDGIAVELRKILNLPISRSESEEFLQTNFEELSGKIQESFSNIKIIDNYHSDRSYILRKVEASQEIFEISVGLDMVSEKRIDCLMHELAHFLMHNGEIRYDVPKWKNAEPWEQEDEANCFSRAFLMPKDYFLLALVKFSRNDGTVDIEQMASYFEVQENLIIERGRDLFVWN